MSQAQIVGVDIAKSSFDAEWYDGKTYHNESFSNDEPGYARLLAWLPPQAWVVMEATGTYYLRLATWLHQHHRVVSVVNPAQPAYFARMKLMRAKTDPVDARILRQYGECEAVKRVAWAPADPWFTELNQLDSHIVGLQKDLNQVTNRLEALSQCVTVDGLTLQDLTEQRQDLVVRIKRCEQALCRRVREQFGELYRLLISIQGIGMKTAVMFIVMSQANTRFFNAKKFAAYVGLTSFIKRSGSSLKGRGGITKMGQARMRQLLYMAALTAQSSNKACQTFAARLKANGKPAKVVRVAVANKLIRQAFAVMEKQEVYSEACA